FRVADYHTYFIAPRDLAFDVWVHNTYADARKLRANLVARGRVAQEGDHAAHLVPTGSFSNRAATVQSAVADAQGVLARRGIDLNSHRNGFFSDLKNHYGTHRDNFLLDLGKRLQRADSADDSVRSVLREIKQLRSDVLSGQYL
ncbi:MAG: AHH domain-containing protein, partial [Planctomycetales bacterium]|nr:AHH domain-containing protein [Planctomycetales bacterium]